MKAKLIASALALSLTAVSAARAQPGPPSAAVPVTVDNFIRAETDLYMGNIVKDVVSENSITGVNRRRSITRPSFASTAIPCILRQCSTSMLDR
jgi:hypothetical protein